MSRARERGWDAVAVVAIVAVALAQLWPGLSNGLSPPISWDHGAHIGKAMVTWDELCPSLRGWTDRFELGVPLNALYGLGGTVWILLARVLTFARLDWFQTYAVAIAAFRALVGLSVYRLARTHGAGPLGAAFGAVMALADPGDHSEGGWFYDVTYGVWPMSLSMCFVVLGLAELPRALDGAKPARARAALWLGASLVAHPFALPVIALTLPCVLLSRALDGERVRATVVRLLPVVVVAGLVGGWWFLPFLASRRELDDHGQLYLSFKELGQLALDAKLPLRAGPWETVLVPLALLFGLFSRGARRVLALSAAAALLVSSRSWLYGLDVLRFLPLLGRIMYPRFLMFAKPLFFALVALLADDLVVRAAAALRSVGKARARLAVALALAAFVPLSTGAWDSVKASVLTRDVVTTDRRAGFDDLLAFAAWARAQPAEPFFRIAYFDDSSHLFQIAGGLTGHGSHQLTPIVAEVFRATSPTADPRALYEMNVRYAVSWGSRPPGVGFGAREVQRFGLLGVWELPRWSPERVVDPGGAHHPRTLSVSRDALTIEPAGATHLLVRRAWTAAWRAEADGRPLAIGRHPVPDADRLFLLELRVPPGTRRVTVHYRDWRAVDVLALLSLLAGLAGAALLGTSWRPPATLVARVRAVRVPRRLLRRGASAVAALSAGVVLGAVVSAVSRYDAVRHLDDARVAIRAHGVDRRCTVPYHDGGVFCGPADWLHVGPVIQPVDGILRECVWAHPPPPAGTLGIDFPHARLSGRLHLEAGTSDEALGGGRGTPVDLRVLVDGAPLVTLSVPNGRAWLERDVAAPTGDHTLRIEVHATDDGRRFLCFDATSP